MLLKAGWYKQVRDEQGYHELTIVFLARGTVPDHMVHPLQ